MIIAPDASEEAIAIVAAKKNLRLLSPAACPIRAPKVDCEDPWPAACWCSRATMRRSTRCSSRRHRARADDAELADLRFAFRVAKHVKSNTIVYAKDRATVGIGAGQMSRVDAARIAARKAEDAARETGCRSR